ncbi:MAG: Hsp20/alpha crystallin family protein [Planctomycetaceae bacterium]
MLANRLSSSLDPLKALRAFEQQLNQQFADWLQSASARSGQGDFRMWTGDGSAVVEFDLPGFTPAAIDVAVHKNLLTIAALQEPVGTADAGEVHLHERSPVARREFRLPFDAAPERTEAEYRDGVLRVTLHQPEAHRPAKIVVKGL